jgi:hypothetical protein
LSEFYLTKGSKVAVAMFVIAGLGGYADITKTLTYSLLSHKIIIGGTNIYATSIWFKNDTPM